MNCKTGCTQPAENGMHLCRGCAAQWTESPEFERCSEISYDHRAKGDHRCSVALVDFCTRVRAERQNTKPEGT